MLHILLDLCMLLLLVANLIMLPVVNTSMTTPPCYRFYWDLCMLYCASGQSHHTSCGHLFNDDPSMLQILLGPVYAAAASGQSYHASCGQLFNDDPSLLQILLGPVYATAASGQSHHTSCGHLLLQ